MNRFDLPVGIRKLLDELKLESELDLQFETDKGNEIRISDLKSGFWFKLSDFNSKGEDVYYIIKHTPSNRFNNSVKTFKSYQRNLKTQFGNWIKLIEEHHEHSAFFDDPITQHYFDHFSEKFKLKDEDADSAPYSEEQQIQIEKFLLELRTQLDSPKELNATDKEIDELKDDIDKVQKYLPRWTKSQAFKSIIKLIAKAAKYGAKVVIESFVQAYVKALIKG